MTTKKVVADGKGKGTKMTHEQLGVLTGRVDEIKRRVNGGTISFEWVIGELQRVAEGVVVLNTISTYPTYPISVPDQSLAEAIEAGKYDWKNDNITVKNFPPSANDIGEKDVVLFHFNRDISSDDVIAEMDKAGYRPATLRELLALGARYPKLQKEFPIIALGSSCHLDGYRRVPALWCGGYGRCLVLYWFAGDWLVGSRFAAVRK